MTADRSPALIIRFPASATPAARDRLVALLADHDLIAIQEDDVAAPRVWTAHFGTPEARDAAAAAVRTVSDMERPGVEAADVQDEDWARRTQADLPAVRVGRIIVAPPWDVPAAETLVGPAPRSLDEGTGEAPELPRADIVVEIEPSRGFGTGHHQSTRLCLVLLQERSVVGRTVVDVGTGSGVLAIAAAKLGAPFVTAIDVDPDAVDNARENVARNGVSSIVEAHVADLGDAPAPGDIVLANLTGTLLARHARELGALVKPAGALIVAGFTADEREAVADAFSPAFTVLESAQEDDWWAYVLARP